MLLTTILSILSVHAATVPTTSGIASINSDGWLRATLTTAQRLNTYYRPNNQGIIPDNGSQDASGVQWYENGILWMTAADFTNVTTDGLLVGTLNSALSNASYGKAADFLGGPTLYDISATLFGKWNDDILWWALPAVTMMETFSTSAVMANNQLYKKLVDNTLNAVWQQWDTNACNGGLFWSRDRNSEFANQRNYKSAITYF
jgi:hypothetical protein